MYKKLYIYIFFYSLFVNSLFAFSIEAGEDKNITLGNTATIEATVSADVNTAELVWKINNETYAEGKFFYFYPTEIGTYPIQLFYQGHEEDNLTVTATNSLDTETHISKYSVNNKCVQVRVVSGKGHSPSYIYLKEEGKEEQLLYTADNDEYDGKFAIIKSPGVITLQDGGYSVFWLNCCRTLDKRLHLLQFDSNGTMIKNKLWDITGSTTIKQLSNQNYVLANCSKDTYVLHVDIYDYASNNNDYLYRFYPPHMDYPCNFKGQKQRKPNIMSLSNGTFVLSFDDKLWHYDNNGNEIPFN